MAGDRRHIPAISGHRLGFEGVFQRKILTGGPAGAAPGAPKAPGGLAGGGIEAISVFWNWL